MPVTAISVLLSCVAKMNGHVTFELRIIKETFATVFYGTDELLLAMNVHVFAE